MCKVSKEAIIRANKSTMSGHASNNIVTSEAMNISVRYHGTLYSRQITFKEARTSFAKAMNEYGQKL